MAAQPVGRRRRRATRADVGSDERRGWFAHGLAALGISALGLAIAGSISLTTSAQPLPAAGPAPARPASSASGPETEPSQARAAALDSFAPRGATGQDTQGTALRGAVLREQAAQRAEELAKSADDLTRAAQTASSDARQDKLDAADAANAKAAALLAEQRLRKAIADRLAAAAAREAAQRSAAASDPAPGTAAPAPGPAPAPAPDRSTPPTGGGGASPVPGAVIGARWRQYGIWSRWHTGIDFRASYGTPIRAVKSGVVVLAGNSGDWAGNHVAVRHGDGLTTMSSHMSSMAVRSGQTVAAGQVIGYVGQTGRAFGAHLHFELYPAGVRPGDVYKTVDPQPWLAAAGVRTN